MIPLLTLIGPRCEVKKTTTELEYWPMAPLSKGTLLLNHPLEPDTAAVGVHIGGAELAVQIAATGLLDAGKPERWNLFIRVVPLDDLAQEALRKVEFSEIDEPGWNIIPADGWKLLRQGVPTTVCHLFVRLAGAAPTFDLGVVEVSAFAARLNQKGVPAAATVPLPGV